MQRKYGMARNTCGVYCITNKLSGKKYVGSSVDISARLSTHFGRDTKRYPHRDMYRDIIEYGLDGFNIEVLEVCTKEDLIEREQFWFDEIHPEYNLIRPQENHVLSPIVIKLAQDAQHTDEYKQRMCKIHATDEFREKCRNIQRKRMKSVRCIETDSEFESISEAARWLISTTVHKPANAISKIKSVCDGDRASAYGYHWEYVKV